MIAVSEGRNIRAALCFRSATAYPGLLLCDFLVTHCDPGPREPNRTNSNASWETYFGTCFAWRSEKCDFPWDVGVFGSVCENRSLLWRNCNVGSIVKCFRKMFAREFEVLIGEKITRVAETSSVKQIWINAMRKNMFMEINEKHGSFTCLRERTVFKTRGFLWFYFFQNYECRFEFWGREWEMSKKKTHKKLKENEYDKKCVRDIFQISREFNLMSRLVFFVRNA